MLKHIFHNFLDISSLFIYLFELLSFFSIYGKLGLRLSLSFQLPVYFLLTEYIFQLKDRLARLEAALVPKKGRFYGKLGLLLSLSIQKIIRSSLLTICILASSHFLILAFGGWGILDAGNEELLKMVSKLQSELEAVKAEHVSEKQKVCSFDFFLIYFEVLSIKFRSW